MKKKRARRFFSLLLSLTILLSCAGFTAYAEEASPEEGVNTAEEAEMFSYDEVAPETVTENSVYTISEIGMSVYVSAEFTEATEDEKYPVIIDLDEEEQEKGTITADYDEAEASTPLYKRKIPVKIDRCLPENTSVLRS